MFRRLHLLLGALALAPGPIAGEERFVHLGSRSAAMGGAFTAVADDSTAFHWNPAGYAFGSFLKGGAHWGREQMDRGAFVDALGDRGGAGRLISHRIGGFSLGFSFMGVSAMRIRQTSSTRTGEQVASRALDVFDLNVSILQSLPLDDLVLGINLHYLDGEVFRSTLRASQLASGEDAAGRLYDLVRTGRGARSRTATVDLAALYQPREGLRFGVMWRRLTEPGFDAPQGEEVVLPRHARAGVAVSLPRDTLVAFDLDLSSQGVGTESWREVSFGVSRPIFGAALSLHAGLRAEIGSELGARPVFSIGAASRIAGFVVDLAYVGPGQARDDAIWIGVSVAR